MKNYFSKEGLFFNLASLVLMSIITTSTALASTTISTNIQTDGTLSVTSGITTSGTTGGYKIDGNLILQASSTLSNLALGYQSLLSAVPDAENPINGTYNTGLGYQALLVNTAGYRNTATGYQALTSNTTGTENTATGQNALGYNTTGSRNTAFGKESLLKNVTGTDNTTLGFAAGSGTLNNSFTGNTVIGSYSGFQLQTDANYNTILGYQAGYGISTGSSNLILATATSSASMTNLTTGSQNILIGNNISLPSATANGQLNIGNLIYGAGITGTGSTLSPGYIGIGTQSPLNNFVVSDGGAGGLEVQPGSVFGTGSGVRFISIDRSGGDVYKDFFFYQSNGGTTLKANGNVGIGTTSPATKLHVSSGASATTTVTIGELGLSSSKACVNMNQVDGSAGSFYIAGGVMRVESNYCR